MKLPKTMNTKAPTMTDNVTERYRRAVDGAVTQYRAMFRQMATVGGRWHYHVGTAGYVLLQDGAACDVPLPVVLRDVQALTEEQVKTRLLADGYSRAFS